MHLIPIVDIVSGTSCLLTAILLHFSSAPFKKSNEDMYRGRLLIELLLILTGIFTYTTSLSGEKYYEALKAGLIQSILPLGMFLFSWGILYSVGMRQQLGRLIKYQLAAVSAIITVNLLYLGLYSEHTWYVFRYEMAGINLLFLIYYIRFFSYTARICKSIHPHAGLIYRPLIKIERMGLYTVCTLSILVSLYPDKFFYALYTLLYTTFLIAAVLLYHQYEIQWNIHRISDSNKRVDPEEKTEKENSATIAAPMHIHRQATLSNDKIAERVKEWIENKNYRQVGITITMLSKELGINRTYLSNFINEIYGTNFNGWVNELRIKEAKRKMSESPELSLSEIADFVGFADPAHFSKQFKQNEGISPSVWKKNNVRDKKK